MIPGLRGLIVIRIAPLLLERGDRRSTPAPLTWTRMPFAGLPSSVTRTVSLVRLPTVVDLVVTLTAMQPWRMTAGVNGPVTRVVACAELFAVVVSCSLPTTVARLRTTPGDCGVTTI